MRLYSPPQGLEIVAHFTLPRVQTWAKKTDEEYREKVRLAAAIPSKIREKYEWYAFSISCKLAHHRGMIEKQIPDVENIPKLIVDAFTKVLYEDDDVRYVRGVQVEAELSADEEEYAEITIYGYPHKV